MPPKRSSKSVAIVSMVGATAGASLPMTEIGGHVYAAERLRWGLHCTVVGVSAGRVRAGSGRPEPGQVQAGSHGTWSEPGHGGRNYGQVPNPDLNLTKPDQTLNLTASVAQTVQLYVLP